jgi:hypothetical protein
VTIAEGDVGFTSLVLPVELGAPVVSGGPAPARPPGCPVARRARASVRAHSAPRTRATCTGYTHTRTRTRARTRTRTRSRSHAHTSTHTHTHKRAHAHTHAHAHAHTNTRSPQTHSNRPSPRQGFDITVVYSTGGGTATPGVDYVAVSNASVVIPAGTTSKNAQLQIIGDRLQEPDETFNVTFGLLFPNGSIVSTSVTVVTIQDDDVRGINGCRVARLGGGLG